MTKFFPRQLLYRLRNEIPVARLLTQVTEAGSWTFTGNRRFSVVPSPRSPWLL